MRASLYGDCHRSHQAESDFAIMSELIEGAWASLEGKTILLGLMRAAFFQEERVDIGRETISLERAVERFNDGFLNHKVKIEGKKQSNIKAQYPVILVTKITLVL